MSFFQTKDGEDIQGILPSFKVIVSESKDISVEVNSGFSPRKRGVLSSINKFISTGIDIPDLVVFHLNRITGNDSQKEIVFYYAVSKTKAKNTNGLFYSLVAVISPLPGEQFMPIGYFGNNSYQVMSTQLKKHIDFSIEEATVVQKDLKYRLKYRDSETNEGDYVYPNPFELKQTTKASEVILPTEVSPVTTPSLPVILSIETADDEQLQELRKNIERELSLRSIFRISSEILYDDTASSRDKAIAKLVIDKIADSSTEDLDISFLNDLMVLLKS